MLKVHLSTGETLRFDLGDPTDAERWITLSSKLDFQASISGLTIDHNGMSFSIPRPRSLDLCFLAEKFPSRGRSKGAEKVSVNNADVRVDLTVHSGQRAGRVDIIRAGWQRFG